MKLDAKRTVEAGLHKSTGYEAQPTCPTCGYIASWLEDCCPNCGHTAKRWPMVAIRWVVTSRGWWPLVRGAGYWEMVETDLVFHNK